MDLSSERARAYVAISCDYHSVLTHQRAVQRAVMV